MRHVTGIVVEISGAGEHLGRLPGVRGEGPGHTWHRDNVYAAREHYPNRRIDYIFVRGPDRWHRGEPLLCKVVLDQPRDGVFASDHFGVYTEIRATSVVLPPL